MHPHSRSNTLPQTHSAQTVRFAGRSQTKGVRLLRGRDAQSRKGQRARPRRERRRVRVQLPYAGETPRKTRKTHMRACLYEAVLLKKRLARKLPPELVSDGCVCLST